MARSSQHNGASSPEEAHSEQENVKVKEFSQTEELQGKLTHSETLDKLMHSVIENNKDLIDEGHVITGCINQGLQSFTPDLLFESLVNNYKQTKKITGERFIRELTGYDSSYIDKNIRIPEFKRELKDKLQQSYKNLQDKGLIDKNGSITQEGFTIASISLVSEELDRLNTKGILGERSNKAKAKQGESYDVRIYQSGDKYKDLSVSASIKKTLRRGRSTIHKDDLVVNEYQSKQRASIIYAIDSSGSMKGEKLVAAKRAGVALAYKAIRKKDLVGCLLFGKKVRASQHPTKDFQALVNVMLKAQAAKETDIAQTILHAKNMFTGKGVKHLVILTDGLQTVGTTNEVLQAASKAYNENITISIIGLRLDEQGEALCKQIVELGKGTLYLVKDYENIDLLVLEDYYKARN